MNRGRATLRASAVAPGTCGELCQGIFQGIHSMVTCPIDMYSVATVELLEGERGVSGPTDSPKAKRAVQATLDYLQGTSLEAHLSLKSALPRGKGMASSTTDVAASIVATASALGRELAPGQIAEIALNIEPSDGIMFPGIALFDHVAGRVARTLGPAPPLRILVLDFGGEVDTGEFNRACRWDVLKRLEPETEQAVSLIKKGIKYGDIGLIGRGATLSAVANQQVLPTPHLEAVLELSQHVRAVGVNVAHSGTVIGILLPDDAMVAKQAAGLAFECLPELESMLCQRVIGGGVKVLRRESPR